MVETIAIESSTNFTSIMKQLWTKWTYSKRCWIERIMQQRGISGWHKSLVISFTCDFIIAGKVVMICPIRLQTISKYMCRETCSQYFFFFQFYVWIKYIKTPWKLAEEKLILKCVGEKIQITWFLNWHLQFFWIKFRSAKSTARYQSWDSTGLGYIK